jgi:autotransporter adhesin
MLSDVPIGSLLSGGIDSTLITAIMQKNSKKPIKTFTIGFEDKTFNEAGYAASIAGKNSIGLGSNTAITADTSIAIGADGVMSGTRSIGLGYGTSVTGSNSIAIGYGTTITASNEVFIGNSLTTSIGGTVNWTATSDGRFKTNVEGNVPGLDFIRELKPVTYNFDLEKLNAFNESNGLGTSQKADVRYSGFIAQDVHTTAKKLGYDFSGVKVPENDETNMYGLRYAEFVVPLVQATQELDTKDADLQRQIDEQQDLIVAQQQLIENYNSTLSRYEESMTDLKSEVVALEVKVNTLEIKVETESSLEASSDNK